MKKGKLFALLILAVVAFFVIRWSYPIIKDRYFSPSEPASEEEDTFFLDKEEEATDETAQQETTQEQTEESKLEVTDQDCSEECSRFTTEEDKKYCREVCGLGTTEESTDCQSKQGVDKDYCLKDQAVSKRDFSICEEITDASIKEVCQNRITEDILEEQN